MSCSHNEDPYEAYRKGNYAAAINGFTLLAEQGDLNALTHLGVMYQLGFGVDKDITKAIRFYKAAAEKGDAPGQYNLGLMYYEGVGVKQDYKKAYEMFKKAAKQNHSKAQSRVDNIISEIKIREY